MNENNSIFCDFCNKKLDITPLLTNTEEINIDYLHELLRDFKIIANLSQIISKNVKRLLEREIMISRHILFHQKYVTKQANDLSKFLKSESATENVNVVITEKVLVPVHLNPTYNFIGRILGPGGLTLKQIEREFDCKIKIRGKGSVRNLTKENNLRKRSNNVSHQQDDLHLIISVCSDEQTARQKIKSVENYIKLLFDEAVSKSIDEDEAKQNQLMEYAIVKGTYRDMSFKHNKRHSRDSNTDSNLNDSKRQIFQSSYFSAPILPATVSPVIFYNQLPNQISQSILPPFGYSCKLGMFNIK